MLGIDKVNPAVLVEKGVVKHAEIAVKILGNGDIDTSINVNVDFFSDSAKNKIENITRKESINEEKTEILNFISDH